MTILTVYLGKDIWFEKNFSSTFYISVLYELWRAKSRKPAGNGRNGNVVLVAFEKLGQIVGQTTGDRECCAVCMYAQHL